MKKRIIILGINHRSILFDSHSIKFPCSFALDIMHLMFENVAKYMFKHWIGTFFNNNVENNYKPYILNITTWNEIGNLMHWEILESGNWEI